jgi:hypothetical protein
MRSSGLEPPRGKLPTRPSTSYTRARYVRRRLDRPIALVGGHIGRNWRTECCHDVATASPTEAPASGASLIIGILAIWRGFPYVTSRRGSRRGSFRPSVRYVLISGIALIRHGVVRATADVDAVLDPSEENLGRLGELIAE